MRKINKILSVLVLTGIYAGTLSAQEFPEKPVPPRLVNDFAGMLKPEEINALENKLVAFNDSSSTQIAIVTLNDLHGYSVADYGQRLAEKWGIGQKGMNNGILILVKPRTDDSQGKITIETGYGLEGAIPDLTCQDIINNEMIPEFRKENYFKGLDKATDILIALARGEFPADKYGKGKKAELYTFPPILIIIIILFIIIFMRGKGGRNQRHISKSGLPLWLLLSMMNSGKGSHNGSWGGFSGGGGFGGGGGGFGGFGGGSFGGGGASGSW